VLVQPFDAFLVPAPITTTPRRGLPPPRAASPTAPSPSDLAPTAEQLQQLKEEEEVERQQRQAHQERLRRQRRVRVELERGASALASASASSASEWEALLGPLTDLLIEGGALEVSYATTRAALGGPQVKLSVTVPSGDDGDGEDGDDEDMLGVDVEGLVRLALEHAQEGQQPASASAIRFTVHEAPVLCGLDWMRAAAEGEEGFDPVLAGKFHVVPVQRSGLLPLPPPAEHELRILPGEGWGTGQHPTTRLCLDFLSRGGVICGGERVIDYGCGSGILSIAAVQLGAREASGVDIEYGALESARVNTQLNHVEDEVEVLHAREVVPGEFAPADIVLANILVGTLLRMATTIVGAVRPGGWLVLCGLRPEQLETIKRKYEPYIEFDESLEAREEVEFASWGTGAGWWCRLVGRKKAVAGGSWVECLSEAAVS
jgi:ribosomal protein L11 methyltransferase